VRGRHGQDIEVRAADAARLDRDDHVVGRFGPRRGPFLVDHLPFTGEHGRDHHLTHQELLSLFAPNCANCTNR